MSHMFRNWTQERASKYTWVLLLQPHGDRAEHRLEDVAGLQESGGEATLGQQEGTAGLATASCGPRLAMPRPATAAAAQRPARRRHQPADDRATEEMAQRSSARPGRGRQGWLGRHGAAWWSAMELHSLSMVTARTGERREALGWQREWGGEWGGMSERSVSLNRRARRHGGHARERRATRRWSAAAGRPLLLFWRFKNVIPPQTYDWSSIFSPPYLSKRLVIWSTN